MSNSFWPEHLANFINGELVAPIGGAYFDNIEPATGKPFTQIPDSDERDVEEAYKAAAAAFPIWSATPAMERSKILLRLSALIEQNLDQLAIAESTDNGKPVKLAKHIDIPRAAANFHFFATAIEHFASEAHMTDGEAVNYTLRQPLGVVGCISPWNLPLYLFSWKVAPAIASGCTVVAKPSEITPLTAYLLGELCIEAGLPNGVLNIVQGVGPKVGAAIVAHPKIVAISFTGGTVTGKQIASVAAPMFKPMSLELGGKNASIVFESADFEDAVSTVARAAYTNQGEICLCGSRILVQASIYERFQSALLEKVKAISVGDPNESSSQMGALVSEGHMNKVLSYIALAKDEGGNVLCGGEKVEMAGKCEGGYFVSPALIEGLGPDCRTNQEEIFGPVATIYPFETEEEGLEMVNGTPYGLSANVFTTDLKQAHRVAAGLHVGVVWVNTWLFRDLRTPFGGVKQSGVGREGGFEALRFFTEPKNVCIKL
jgi:aminomuconate-semialdehyde/2-hydroxymuconate-6-semialdehyde dehydrogenase